MSRKAGKIGIGVSFVLVFALSSGAWAASVDPADGNEYYANALHAVLRAKDEAGVKNVVLHDIDGCGSVEMIIVDEGIPEIDDHW